MARFETPLDVVRGGELSFVNNYVENGYLSEHDSKMQWWELRACHSCMVC